MWEYMIKKFILMSIKAALVGLLVLSASACDIGSPSHNTYLQNCPVPVYDVSFFDSGYALNCSPNEDGSAKTSYGLACYVDYATNTIVPRCSKSNCDHSTEDCAAARECVNFFVYENSFYRLYDSPERTDDGEVISYTVIARSNMDGTNEQAVARFEGSLLNMSSAPRNASMFLYEGNLYVWSYLIRLTDGASDGFSEIMMYSVSLETGQVKEICTLAKGYNPYIVFIGATEEKAYYFCHYKETEIKSSDYETMEEFFEALTAAEYTSVYFSVSITDGTIENFEYCVRNDLGVYYV